MASPWLSYSVALVIATLVSVTALAVFTTDPGEFRTQDGELPDGIKNASEDALLTFVRSGTRDQQIAAIFELADSSGNMDKIVPAIAKAAIGRDELVRTAAFLALKKLGPTAADHIDVFFESDDINEFRRASVVLQQIGPDGKRFIPKYKPILKEDNTPKVMAALFGLENMGNEALPLMDELIALLDHEEFNIQCAVCRIFEKMGADAMPAQDRLVVLLDNGVVSARSWAAIALGAIGPSEEHDVVELLAQKLTAFTQIEKERAMIGLGHLGKKAAAATDEVWKLMTDPSKNSQTRGAYTYWRITGEIDEPLKILTQQLDTLSYKRDAIRRLSEMGPDAAPMLAKLQKELDNEEDDVVELAVLAIGNLGEAAKPAIPALIEKLKHDDLLIREAARESIAKIKAASQAQEK